MAFAQKYFGSFDSSSMVFAMVESMSRADVSYQTPLFWSWPLKCALVNSPPLSLWMYSKASGVKSCCPGPVGNNFWCPLSTACGHLKLHSCVSWSIPKKSRWSCLQSPSSTCNLLWMLEWLVLPHLCVPFVRARLPRPPWLVERVASSLWQWCMVCRTPVFQSGAECPGVGPLLPCGESGPWKCAPCIGAVCMSMVMFAASFERTGVVFMWYRFVQCCLVMTRVFPW